MARLSSLVRCLAYIGNEDTSRNDIDGARRSRVLSELLAILIDLGDKAVESFGLFSRPDGENAFCAFGFRYWGSTWSDYRSYLRELALGILRDQLSARHNTTREAEQLLSQAP